jgi:2-keto-4-pentenoate hydratase/2-oxohepta-3-ene-1,7-dioic acid hydratase in catechol pathway
MSADLLFPAPAWPTLTTTEGGRIPLGRIFCVGRNYEAHAAEMGVPGDVLDGVVDGIGTVRLTIGPAE